MMTLNDLQKKWNETSPFSGGFLQISEEHPLSVHVGYENDLRCFVILDTGRIDNIDSSKAIDAVCIELSAKKFGLKFLLKYPSLDELFIKLCWDLMECSKDAEYPLNAMLDRYSNWLILLQKAKAGIMSASRQKGLLAELLYLQDQIQLIGEDDALSAWVGPEGCDQDFVFSDSWSEVKATVKASNSVLISSLQQLDREETGELIVYFMDKLSAQSDGDHSLPQVVDEVKDMIQKPHNKDLYDCKLAMYGYYCKDTDQYQNIYYSLSEIRKYEVNLSFPRLSVNNIPHEIIEAKYRIDLSSIENYRH